MLRPQKHSSSRHFRASRIVLTTARLLKHDLPVHGIGEGLHLLFCPTFWAQCSGPFLVKFYCFFPPFYGEASQSPPELWPQMSPERRWDFLNQGARPRGRTLRGGVLDIFWKPPFSEPILRILLTTLFYCKPHSKPPSKNLVLLVVVVVLPVRRAPNELLSGDSLPAPHWFRERKLSHPMNYSVGGDSLPAPHWFRERKVSPKFFWPKFFQPPPQPLGVRKRVISKRVVLADVPVYRNFQKKKQKKTFPPMLPWQKTAMSFDIPGQTQNEGTFAKTALSQNRSLVSARNHSVGSNLREPLPLKLRILV